MDKNANKAIKGVAVLSAGNGGITFAAHLLEVGGVEWVSLYNRSQNRLNPIRANNNRIFARGVIGGVAGREFQLALITGDPVDAIQGADLIIMAGTQPAIDFLGQAIAPQVTCDQIVIIGSGTLGSTWEMQASLRTGHCADLPLVGEFNVLPYATKLDEGQQGRVWVRGVKEALDIAFSPPESIPPSFRDWLLGVYPYLNIFPDVLYTGLAGANMVVHPVVVLRNQEKVNAGKPWRLYTDGVSPEVGEMLDLVDLERLAIAEACNLKLDPLYQFLVKAYPPFEGVTVSNLYEWFHSRMRSSSGQIHLEAVPGPTSFHVRLLEEDVPYGMVPLEGLGQLLGVSTPMVSMFIDEACELLDVDYRLSGRTVKKMEFEIMNSLTNIGVKLDT